LYWQGSARPDRGKCDLEAFQEIRKGRWGKKGVVDANMPKPAGQQAERLRFRPKRIS